MLVTANIVSESTKYHIGSNPCGDIIFKLILQTKMIDTRATYFNMREKISSIYTYISTVNYDIEKFNEYANINYELLDARGAR